MSNVKKNTTLPLPISPGYVQSWGFWEALREFVQNGLDGQDKGWPLSIERGKGKGRAIKIRNEGADLTRDTLLLGTSSKRGDNAQRGQFGEGYKLAALVLCRLGFEVQIRTQNEMWDFEILHSSEFGAPTLHVHIRPAPAQDFIEVRISPSEALVAQTDDYEAAWDSLWTTVTQRVINVPSIPSSMLTAKDKIETWRGTILTSSSARGLLFCRGLYVGRLPEDDYTYGYDLSVELDRDRRMADPWSLRYAIASVYEAALSAKLIDAQTIKQVFDARSAEARAISEFPSTASSVAKVLAEQFVATYGEEAVPVATYGECESFEHVNLKPIVVDRGLRAMIEQVAGNAEARMTKRKSEVKALVQPSDLNDEERSNLRWACDLVQQAIIAEYASGYTVLDNVTVAEFHSDNILGLYESGAIRVSRKQLASRQRLIGTIAHEVAHHVETFEAASHGAILQSLLARIIVSLA